ncbi:MAG: hypothetical protein NT075_37095 [Chloroflexi bacterium]|nr:hypothetical protein [Chloroflexota bacterium]
MEITKITVDLLETAFKQWRQAQAPPAELLELDLLSLLPARSAVERAFELYDYLVDLVKQQLTLYRQAEAVDLPAQYSLQRQSLLVELAGDFQVNNATLEAWSILYYRYLSGIQLTIPELAKGASVEERQIRRRLELGLRLLWI